MTAVAETTTALPTTTGEETSAPKTSTSAWTPVSITAELSTTTSNDATTTTLTTAATTTEADTTTTQETTTFEQTSPELTTVAASSVRSSPPPDVRCCCRCCFQSTPTCTFCDRDSLTEASECANEPPPVPTPVDRETPKFEAPPPLKGSAFPERLALRKDFIKKEQLTETLAALPTSEKVALGFQTTDLLVDCQFDKSPCSIDDFTSFYNPILGNCYMFNSGWNDSEPLRVSTRNGKQHGLSLTVNIQQDQYSSEIGNTAGLIVLALPQNLMPFPEDHGMLVSPGYETEVALSLTVLEREAAPYGKCREHNDPKYNVYSETYPVHYSSQACQKTCYQRHVIKQCGCSDAYYPADNASAFDYVTVPVCSVTNITQDDCRYRVSKLFAVNELPCDCPDRCDDKIFSSQSSFAAWPPTRTKRSILRRLRDKLGADFNIDDDEYIANNLLKVNVFYRELSYKEIIEQPGYETIQYISDLGGVLGLWFGFAFMTFIETFELCSDMFVLLLYKFCKITDKRRET